MRLKVGGDNKTCHGILVVHVWCETATNRDNISDSTYFSICITVTLSVMYSKVETAEQKLKFDLRRREKVPFSERIVWL